MFAAAALGKAGSVIAIRAVGGGCRCCFVQFLRVLLLKEKLEAVAAALPGALAVRADLRKEADAKALVDAAIRAHGRVDLLVNNAGQGMYGPIRASTFEAYRSGRLELNLYGALRAMQLV